MRSPNARGLEAKARIIQAAEEVLRRDGYHRFTTRRVADCCGISPGNLGYHFPTKQELLEALFNEVIRLYEEEYQVRQAQFSADADSAFESAVRWLIADAFHASTGELFIELWVHAKHSAEGDRTIGKLYKTGFGIYQDMIAQTFPKSDPLKRVRAARMLVTFLEGAMVLRQTGTFSDSDQEELVRDVLTLVTSTLGVQS